MGAREPGSLARRKKAATAFEIKASGGAVCRLGLIFPGKSPARTDDLQTQIQHRAHRDAEYTEKKSGPGDIRPSQICPFAQLRDEAIRGHSTTGAAIKAPKNPCTRSSADTKAPGPRNCSGRPGLQGRRYRDTRRAADRTNRTRKDKGAAPAESSKAGTGAVIKAPKNPCTRSSADTKAPGPRNCNGRPGLQGPAGLIRSARISIIAPE
jgi:hypothetical protein